MRNQLTILALVLATGVAQAVAAQELPVKASQTVRIHTNDPTPRTLEGVVQSQDSGSLVLWDHENRQIRIPAESVVALEVGNVKRQTGKGALAGGVAGALLGAVVGGVLATNPFFESDYQTVLVGAAIVTGGAVGAGTGALIGTLITRESWTPVQLPARRLAPMAGGYDGRTVVGVRVRF